MGIGSWSMVNKDTTRWHHARVNEYDPAAQFTQVQPCRLAVDFSRYPSLRLPERRVRFSFKSVIACPALMHVLVSQHAVVLVLHAVLIVHSILLVHAVVLVRAMDTILFVETALLA